MKGCSVPEMMDRIICDSAMQDLIHQMDGENVYALHDELDEMKRALSLSLEVLVERINPESNTLSVQLSAISQLNDMQRILNTLSRSISWWQYTKE